MIKIKTILSIFLIFTFLAVSTSARAEDMMESTLRDSLYGGVIGALVGTALLLLTDNPDDHLEYIPTGAGIGVLVGAAYGLAQGSVVRSASEVNDGKVTFNMPTIKREEVFDKKINDTEIIETLDLVRLSF